MGRGVGAVVAAMAIWVLGAVGTEQIIMLGGRTPEQRDAMARGERHAQPEHFAAGYAVRCLFHFAAPLAAGVIVGGRPWWPLLATAGLVAGLEALSLGYFWRLAPAGWIVAAAIASLGVLTAGVLAGRTAPPLPSSKSDEAHPSSPP